MIELAVTLLCVLVFVAGLALISVALERGEDRRKNLGPATSPHDLLDIRLTKGELGEAEYRRLKPVLTYGSLLDLPEELSLLPKTQAG
jgi:uncharacterized membrane protein